MSKHQWLSIPVVVFVALLAGCRSDAEKPVADVTSRNFVRQWQADLRVQGDAIEHVYVRDKSIFVYTQQHRVYILERGGGRIETVYSVGKSAIDLFPPVLVANRVVYPTNSHLEEYDLKGNFIHEMNLGVSIRSGGGASDKMMYLGADYQRGGRLLQIDPAHEDKPIRWELMTFGGISAVPAVYQGVVFCGSEDGRVYAVSEERDGVWPTDDGVFVTDGRILADLKVDDFGVYVASTDSKLYCLGRGNGKIRWQYFAGTALTEAPAVTSDFVYQFVRGKGIVALTKTEAAYNREAKWTAADGVQFLAEDEKYAYVARGDHSIVAVEKSTGQEKFASDTGYIAFGTNTKDGTIFAATSDGYVVAAKPDLRPTAGKVTLGLRPESSVAAAR